MFFVGNPTETAEAIVHVLTVTSQYFEYMRHVLAAFLTSSSQERATSPAVVDLSLHPFRPIDVELPTDTTGYCYVLSSLKHPDVTYIGETSNLGQRLDQHNSGSGALQTSSPHLRPWVLLCFVVGFEHDVQARKAFETQWEHLRDAKKRNARRPVTSEELIGLGRHLLRNKPHLRLVVCARRVTS